MGNEIEKYLAEKGLDWKVALEPLFRANGERMKSQAVVRQDNGLAIGEVGKAMTLVQNSEVGEIAQTFADTGLYKVANATTFKNDAIFSLGLSLKEGKADILPNDSISAGVRLLNAHDGSMSLLMSDWAGRHVCMNQLAMIRKGKIFSFKHTRSIKFRVDQVKQQYAHDIFTFRKNVESYKYLAARKVRSESDLQAFTRKVFGIEPQEKVMFQDLPQQSKDKIAKVHYLFADGRGNQGAASGTWWSAYNGVTEYLTHYDQRNRDENARKFSLIHGLNHKRNTTALSTALEMAC